MMPRVPTATAIAPATATAKAAVSAGAKAPATAAPPPTAQGARGGDGLLARRILAHHSRSFSWGARLLPPRYRRDATALYAWCRRCDDAVDGPVDAAAARAAVARLRWELQAVYAGAPQSDPILAGFQDVVRRCEIPVQYPVDLLEGMAMDLGPVRYETFERLLLYCYRVAGTVGLMMAHIMKVKDATALRRATDLGIAMQLTNICRDVVEDAGRGRVYVPDDLLPVVSPSPSPSPSSWPTAAVSMTGMPPEARGDPGPPPATIAELLRRADEFYASGDQGLTALPFRCAVAIRAARLIYAEIGNEIRRRGFDVTSGRAFVHWTRKAWLALRAVAGMGLARVVAAVRGAGAGAAVAAGVTPASSPPPPLPFALVLPNTSAGESPAGRVAAVGAP